MKIFYSFVLALILASCAITPKASLGTHYLPWGDRQLQLSNLKTWELYSVVAIKTSKQNIAAHVNWQQFDDNYTLNITSQFNIGGVKITGDKEQVTLWRSINDKITTRTPEILMIQELGWELPISNMRYWALGLPVPKLAYKSQFDAYNHLIFLQQQGWEINYANFIAVNDVDLPTTIILSNVKLQIKVIIKYWQLKN